MTAEVRRRAASLTGYDADLAAFVSTAMRGYARALRGVGQEPPDGYDELRAALEVLAAGSGQPLARLGRSQEDPGVGGTSSGIGRLALSYAEAAQLAGLGERTLRRHVASGRLPAFRIGRRVLIDPTDLHDFIRGAP